MSMFLRSASAASSDTLLTAQLNTRDYAQSRVGRNHHDVVFTVAKTSELRCHSVAQCLELFAMVVYQYLPNWRK
jgi:hypothetical protein